MAVQNHIVKEQQYHLPMGEEAPNFGITQRVMECRLTSKGPIKCEVFIWGILSLIDLMHSKAIKMKGAQSG